jgi:(2Fe-2S) ferredoxin
MPRPERILFVCTNVRPSDGKESCAGHNGGDLVAAALRAEVKARGAKGPIRIASTGCLGPCNGGPHMVSFPDGVWYAGALPQDAAEIVERHLLGGEPVERLRAPEPEAEA